MEHAKVFWVHEASLHARARGSRLSSTFVRRAPQRSVAVWTVAELEVSVLPNIAQDELLRGIVVDHNGIIVPAWKRQQSAYAIVRFARGYSQYDFTVCRVRDDGHASTSIVFSHHFAGCESKRIARRKSMVRSKTKAFRLVLKWCCCFPLLVPHCRRDYSRVFEDLLSERAAAAYQCQLSIRGHVLDR